MKLEITASALRSALTLIDKVIERRNTIPVLGTVKFDGRKLSATNLDMEITVSVPATRASGAACIEHRPLFGLLKHIAGDEMVSISAGRETATISFAGGRYDLPTLEASDYPDFNLGDVSAMPFNGESFRRALAFAANFMSIEETRYYLNGICVDAEGVVATDGHRLGFHPLGFDGKGYQRAILPRTAVEFITAAPAAQSLSLNEKAALIQFDGMSLSARLIQGTFPDWRRVVPDSSAPSTTITANRSKLDRALARLMSIKASPHYTTFVWSKGIFAMGMARDGEVASREYPEGISFDGAPGHVCFQGNYVRDMLRTFRADDKLKIGIAESGAPTTFKGSADGVFAILMPGRSPNDKIVSALQIDCAELSEQRAAA